MTIFLEQLPEYHEEFDGGIAQFTSVHILRSEAGYAIGHILSPDVSGELIDIVPIIETVRATVPTDVHLLFPNQHGRLPNGGAWWLTQLVSDRPLTNAQSQIISGVLPSSDTIARIGIQLCAVLTKLHQQGLTHGAITPASIIYSTDETWLTEAGFEKQFRLNSRVSTGLPIALRSQYMSPEQLAGHIPSPQSDIYSLGIALFELVTGKFPFGGRTTTTVMASILTDESATNAASGGQEPGYVIKAILRAIEKDPADRWQSAEQFAKAFSENAVSDSAQKLSSRNVVNQSGCASRVLLLLSIVSIMLYW